MKKQQFRLDLCNGYGVDFTNHTRKIEKKLRRQLNQAVGIKINVRFALPVCWNVFNDNTR